MPFYKQNLVRWTQLLYEYAEQTLCLYEEKKICYYFFLTTVYFALILSIRIFMLISEEHNCNLPFYPTFILGPENLVHVCIIQILNYFVSEQTFSTCSSFFLWVHGCYLNYIMEYNFEIKCVGLFNIWFRIYLPCVNLKYESWHIHVHIPYPETKGNKFWTRNEIEANVELIIIS